MSNEPGKRTPQEVLHQIVIPTLSRLMNKGNVGHQIKRLHYTSDPVYRVTWVEVETDAGEKVRLVLDPMPTETDRTVHHP